VAAPTVLHRRKILDPANIELAVGLAVQAFDGDALLLAELVHGEVEPLELLLIEVGELVD